MPLAVRTRALAVLLAPWAIVGGLLALFVASLVLATHVGGPILAGVACVVLVDPLRVLFKRGVAPPPPDVAQDAVAEAAVRAACPGAPPRVRFTLRHELSLHGAGPETTLLVGVPLLATSRPDELAQSVRAVLAGGTRLSPALRRQAVRLGQIDAELDNRRPPTRQLRPLIKRIVHANAAAQHAVREAADRTVDADAARRYEDYWRYEVLPCLSEGYRPPIVEGWLALTGTASGTLAAPRPQLEAAILAQRDGGAQLVPIRWPQVAELVWLPLLRRGAAGAAEVFGDLTLGDLAALELPALAPTARERVDCAVALALHRAGWAVADELGGPLRVVGDPGAVAPLGLADALADDPSALADFVRFLGECGLADVPLAPEPPSRPEPPDHLGSAGAVRSQQAVTIPLTVGRPLRQGLWAGGGLTVLALALLLAGAAFLWSSSQTTFVGHLILVVTLAGALTAGGRYLSTVQRLLQGPAQLTIDTDTVRLEYPGLLRVPWQVPRVLLRTVAYDASDAARDPAGRRIRFPVRGHHWHDSGSAAGGAVFGLWSETGPLVPMVGLAGDRPTVALVFTEPVAGPHMRRPHAASPLPDEGVAALLLVADAGSTLSASGLLGPITEHDLDVVREAAIGVRAPVLT